MGSSIGFLAALGLLIAAAVVFAILKKNSSSSTTYQTRKYLLSPAERLFLGVLNSAIGDQFYIFPKMNMRNVLKETSGLNSTPEKHFDFVLCHRDTLEIACCIDLNDRTEEKRNREGDETFAREACTQAKVPFLQIQARSSFNCHLLRDQVLCAAAGIPVAAGAVDTYSTMSIKSLAKKLGISPGMCHAMLVEQGLVDWTSSEGAGVYTLTEKGAAAGGISINHPLLGNYIKWPANIFQNDQNGHFQTRSHA